MKVYLVFLWIFFAAPAVFSQDITFNRDSISYKIIDSNLTAGKTDLHRKAQGWIIDHFGDDKESIRLDDMDTGEITGKASISTGSGRKTSFLYRVSSRDRQYECEIHTIGDSSNKRQQPRAEADRKIRSLLQDLHKRMRNDKNFAKPSVDTIPKL
jgi:hypothetical protein